MGLTGNDAAAHALRQVNPDVAAVFPITPQTELMHKFSEFVANGQVQTLLVNVESEHSAMSASVGASAAGARAVTATAANGLALMWEIVAIASSLRLPIVMPVVNRAISGPLNIHCDHSDSMGCRDLGWIQLYCENSQEAYDNTIMAFRIGEDPEVKLPVMICLDGFILSHTMERVEIIADDKMVTDFVGEYKPEKSLLNAADPVTYGPLDLTDWLFEHKRQEVEGMKHAFRSVKDVSAEYGRITGRAYDYVEKFMLDDAEFAVVALGSTAGTAKAAVRELRAEGVKAGLLKIRMFRPFPGKDICEALAGCKAVSVMDRSFSFGLEGGPAFNEIRGAAYGAGLKVPMVSHIYGIGGRDINVSMIRGVFGQLKEIAAAGKVEGDVERYVGLRD
ncbi:MAG: pyruvate ferredoxin oxidoreductase [Planctomycetota bacterium]|jgi:pyruvate ferredoxin oxidoreductase alpha subunit